ncbi:hypothetical protein AK37_05577 [Rhodococcus pyridinivorans AK37]|uniref:Uncharacterized protein n=2 Tax=Rhodococcus pyridinivorans TaxID=103816 RepID=H0JND2_9NOCA|nr:hypothetical protein AK37_05577 [Rhodococcus pyridinivorans AK37]
MSAVTVNLAQAADSAQQVTNRIEWWPGALVPIGVVVAALLAGYFGGRNARKTPHEKLAALVDIYDKLGKRPGTFPEQFGILEAAIGHEVENIEKLRAAAAKGRFAYVRERFRVAFSPDNAAFSVALTFFGLIIALTGLVAAYYAAFAPQ